MLETVKESWTLAKWSLKTRLVLLLLQVLLHNVIPDHSGSMEDVFMKKYRTPEHPFIVERLLGGLDNWDAEYFIFNAHSGYDKHEQTMAFFPLLPLGIRALSNSVFYPLGLVLPKRSVALISGVFLNLLLFPLATVILYLLTHKISANNKKVALLAAILFSLNPASVFMSAVYSETPFALLTFLGLLTLEEGKTWLSSLIFALASFTRSNGIVLCGFLGYQCLVSLFKTTWSRSSIHQKLWILSLSLISTAVQCATVLAPFYAFQHYGYMLYCQDGSTLPSSSAPSWCNRTVPIPYSYIQERYWNVGFLRYYELKQLPNFLLATPMVLLGVFGLACYFTGRYFGPSVRTGKNGRAEREGRTQSVRMTFLDDHRLRPYAFHLLFLLAFGICNMHIQVLTRFTCSSSPLIYWVCACQLLRTTSQLGVSGIINTKHFSVREIFSRIIRAIFSGRLVEGVWISRAIVVYFGAYIVLGYTLHCNFYPWT